MYSKERTNFIHPTLSRVGDDEDDEDDGSFDATEDDVDVDVETAAAATAAVPNFDTTVLFDIELIPSIPPTERNTDIVLPDNPTGRGYDRVSIDLVPSRRYSE